MNNPINLIFNFVKLNPSNNSYNKLKISETIYEIKGNKFELTLQNMRSYNRFDSTVNVELFGDNNDNNKLYKFIYGQSLYYIFLKST